MKMRYIIFLLMTIVLGCSQSSSQTEKSFSLVITSPEVAEIAAALGCMDMIKGVTRECDYPEELQQKARVGTFGRVDIEKVMKLEPDLVFVSGLEQQHMAVELGKLGIRVEEIYPQSLEEMLACIEQIAGLCQVEVAGRQLIEELQQEIEEISKVKRGTKPVMYVEIYGDPLMSVADSSFVGELVELAGFDNIFSQLPRDYSRISAEKVVAGNPEYILLLYRETNIAEVLQRKGWSRVEAVQNSRIITPEQVDPDLLVRASPRCLAGVRQLQEILLKDEK